MAETIGIPILAATASVALAASTWDTARTTPGIARYLLLVGVAWHAVQKEWLVNGLFASVGSRGYTFLGDPFTVAGVPLVAAFGWMLAFLLAWTLGARLVAVHRPGEHGLGPQLAAMFVALVAITCAVEGAGPHLGWWRWSEGLHLQAANRWFPIVLYEAVKEWSFNGLKLFSTLSFFALLFFGPRTPAMAALPVPELAAVPALLTFRTLTREGRAMEQFLPWWDGSKLLGVAALLVGFGVSPLVNPFPRVERGGSPWWPTAVGLYLVLVLLVFSAVTDQWGLWPCLVPLVAVSWASSPLGSAPRVVLLLVALAIPLGGKGLPCWLLLLLLGWLRAHRAGAPPLPLRQKLFAGACILLTALYIHVGGVWT